MTKWLRRVRGAVLTGLTWALVWAPVAVLIGLYIDPDGSMDEMWHAAGAYAGFLGGVMFAAVLGVAARRRRLDELSLPAVAAWGALAGLLVGVLPFVLGTPTTERPLLLLASVVIGTITLLSAASAAGSLALARRANRLESIDGGTAARGAAPRGLTDPTWSDRPAATHMTSAASAHRASGTAAPSEHAAAGGPHRMGREP